MFVLFGYVHVLNNKPDKFSAILLRRQLEQFIAEDLFLSESLAG